MTVLAELARGLVSIQCDLCVPPVLTINTIPELHRTRWTLRSAKSPWDVCPNCTVHVAPRHRTPRRDPEPVQPDPARLPNVVVVGATKAGTTSMHNYLGLHPDIAASANKEERFFQDPDCRDWLGIYQSSFAIGTRCRAESTPFYSKSPCFPGVVDRMADLVPDARLIYLVRDPVDRVVAEHVEQMEWGAASRSLEEELADADDPRNPLVVSSRYGTQLREYLRRFGRDRITVIDLADLGTDPQGVMSGVFDFLGLDRPALEPDDFGRFNTRADKRAFSTGMHLLRRGSIVRAMHRLPERPRRALNQFAFRHLYKNVETPQLSGPTEARLRQLLEPEVQELRELTGQPFAAWSR